MFSQSSSATVKNTGLIGAFSFLYLECDKVLRHFFSYLNTRSCELKPVLLRSWMITNASLLDIVNGDKIN